MLFPPNRNLVSGQARAGESRPRLDCWASDGPAKIAPAGISHGLHGHETWNGHTGTDTKHRYRHHGHGGGCAHGMVAYLHSNQKKKHKKE